MPPSELIVNCHTDRPYFAEVPYFLWGAVDYASSGDAATPTDREWRELGLVNRRSGEVVEIAPTAGAGRWHILAVRSPDPVLALRTAYFLTWRTDGQTTISPAAPRETHSELAARLVGWDHAAAIERSVRVRKTFGRAELIPFDDRALWSDWKWVGVPVPARNRAGRWIMDAVLRRDPRAVYLCIGLLHKGTAGPVQADAIRYALQRFTGLDFPQAADWVAWYAREGAAVYPKPDFAAWWAEVGE